MERTCFNKFIELFDCNNTKILSILAAVENCDPGMRDYFEPLIAYFIPMDPVAINKAKEDSKKKISVMFSAVSFDPKLKNLKGE